MRSAGRAKSQAGSHRSGLRAADDGIAAGMATLTGRTIAVPETRELDVFSAMLERRGATVLRCPLVAILDAPDPKPSLEWLRGFNDGACDDLILLTGEGLRRLLSC